MGLKMKVGIKIGFGSISWLFIGTGTLPRGSSSEDCHAVYGLITTPGRILYTPKEVEYSRLIAVGRLYALFNNSKVYITNHIP